MSQPIKIDKNILEAAQNFGLNEDEAKQFFEKLGREPSKEELAVCGALWSEHCSYKSSRPHLKRFHTEEPWVLQGPGENAGVVAITENYGIAFKMESHNHPSYIEPYQGAATGVGGILRDVFCMGAMPIANLNCLRFGEGAWNSKLLRDTVRGIGDYGNSVGVPTIGGDTSFHQGYSKNILVNAFCAGLIHKDEIYKGILSEDLEKFAEINVSNILPGVNIKDNHEVYTALFPEGENLLIYFGSATGRDGVHGATMSSSEFSATAVTLKPTVQVGDPFAEKVLLEATLSLIKKKLTVGLQDMGAAGLTSSCVEMAGRSGCGVVLDLNKVPQRASNMQAWEILLSESQERMVCAVAPEKVDDVIAELNKFNLSTAVIGKVNRTGLFVCIFDDKIATATPVGILVDDTPRYQWPIQEREEYLKNHAEIINLNKEAAWHEENSLPSRADSLSLCGKNHEAHSEIENSVSLEKICEHFPNLFSKLFAHPSFAAKDALFHHYCSTVQGNTVTGCGALQSSSAAVVRLPRYAQENTESKSFTEIGLAIAGGCEERWVTLDPYAGAALTVLKIARKIIAANGIPLAMTDCLNFGSPRAPEVMRQFSDAVDGINQVAKELHIPIVSGNVSLNNQTEGKPIPPTPMIGMVGRVDKVTNVPFNILPKNYFYNHENLHLVHIYPKNALENSSYAASQIAWILGEKNSDCPKLDLLGEKELWYSVKNIINTFKPALCFPVGHGGLLGSLITCALNSNAQLDLESILWQSPAKNLFSEGNMGFVFGISNEEDVKKIIQLLEQPNTSSINNYCQRIGSLKAPTAKVTKRLFDLEKTREVYFQSLQRFYK